MGERNDKGQFKSIELKEDISKGVLQPGEKYNHLTVVKWVDSSIGYVFDNCVPCCKFCNMAKKQYPVEEFENWLKFVVNNNQHLLEDDE